MGDVALVLFGILVLLAPLAFFWINSRNRKAAERKWQRLYKALNAYKDGSANDDDIQIIEQAKRLGLLIEHLTRVTTGIDKDTSEREHAWKVHYSLNEFATSLFWSGTFPDEDEVAEEMEGLQHR